MAHLKGQYGVYAMVSPVLNNHQCSLLIQASREANCHFKYRFLLTIQIILFHLSNTASTPLYHALNSFPVSECKFRLVLSNATFILWDKPARKNTPFHSRKRKRVNYNIQHIRIGSQQAREVTDLKRQRISNCISGTSHISLLQKGRRWEMPWCCKGSSRGAHTESRHTPAPSAQHEIIPLNINTISPVFLQIILQISATQRTQTNQRKRLTFLFYKPLQFSAYESVIG